jgi:hypothetical protein
LTLQAACIEAVPAQALELEASITMVNNATVATSSSFGLLPSALVMVALAAVLMV